MAVGTHRPPSGVLGRLRLPLRDGWAGILAEARPSSRLGPVTKTDAAPAARTGRSTARVGWLAALAGIGAAVTALGVGELLAAAVSPRSSPLVAVGGVVVDN